MAWGWSGRALGRHTETRRDRLTERGCRSPAGFPACRSSREEENSMNWPVVRPRLHPGTCASEFVSLAWVCLPTRLTSNPIGSPLFGCSSSVTLFTELLLGARNIRGQGGNRRWTERRSPSVITVRHRRLVAVPSI